MKVVVYTLTRDRLDYTKIAFASLAKNAGLPFDHVIVDNGSADGTSDWLREYVDERRRTGLETTVIYLPENVGISRAANQALDLIFEQYPDAGLVIKMDNDCRVRTPGLIRRMVDLYRRDLDMRRFGPRMVLSPRVEGIINQPHRGRQTEIDGQLVGLTAIVGGLCHFVQADIYREYRYPENLPLAKGQDDDFCKWVKDQGGECGYVESFLVEHIDGTDGQARRFPEYFERKWREELP